MKDLFQKIDLMEAVHKAKAMSTHLLEDQGITTLSIILAKSLADVIEHPEKIEKMI